MLKKLLLICSLLLCTSACNQHTQAKQTIRLGVSPDFPPFEFKSHGKITGFDVELSKFIAKELNVNLEIYEMDFNSLIPALNAGKIDFIASGLTATKQRAASVDFSDIYYHASIIAITKKGQAVTKLADLANKKIGAQLGSVMENFVNQQKDLQANIQIVSLANNLHLLQELKLGRIDVLMLEEGQKDAILDHNQDLTSYSFSKLSDGYAIAFKKGSNLKKAFNNALNTLNKNGSIKKLEQQFLYKLNSNASNLINSLYYIPKGIILTLKYAFISVFFGLIIGTIISLCRTSSNALLKGFAIIYLSLIRGTPLLLQLFIMYFAFPSLLEVKISAFTAGIIAFSLNSGAYVSENIRAGIESVDKGQFEAAKSLGLSYKTTMQHIIMPQAIRNILPSLVNEAINMIKESSIISVIGQADIMRRANIVSAEHYTYLEPLLVAALCYYLVINIFSVLAKFLEKGLKKS